MTGEGNQPPPRPRVRPNWGYSDHKAAQDSQPVKKDPVRKQQNAASQVRKYAPKPAQKPSARPASKPVRKAVPKSTVKSSASQVAKPAAKPAASTAEKPALTPVPPRTQADGVKLDLREVLKQRKAAQRRLIAYRLMVAFGVIAVIGGLFWLVAFSPLLALKPERTVVEGPESGTSAEHTQTTLSAYEGMPLIRISPKLVENRLKESAGIAEASVSRAWPNGLNVAITERVPTAVMQTPAGFQVLGADGVPIEVVPERPELLPLLTPTAEDEDGVLRETQSAIEVWNGLPEALRARVSSISAIGDRVTLHLFDEVLVLWGTSADTGVKSEVVTLLLEQRPASIYDVSDPRKPVLS